MTNREFREFIRKAQHDSIPSRATALAYTTLVSLVPLLAVAFFIFNAFGGTESIIERIRPLIESNLAPSFGDQISTYLDQFLGNVKAGAVGTLGILGFIVTSVTMLATIEKTFNTVWGIRKVRPLAQQIPTYWSMLSIGPLLIGVSLILSSRAIIWLKDDTGAISIALVWLFHLIPYVTSSLLFTVLFYFMPNTTVNRRDAAKAGIITGLVFEFAKYLYAAYAVRALANASLYGSLAIFPVFLLWLYLVWVIVLLGAELCVYFQFKRYKIPYRFKLEERLNTFVIADILESLAKAHSEPKGGLTQSQLMSQLKMAAHELSNHLDFLEARGWVVCSSLSVTGKRKYHLGVDTDHISMKSILAQLEPYRYVAQSPHGADVQKQFKTLWAKWSLKISKGKNP